MNTLNNGCSTPVDSLVTGGDKGVPHTKNIYILYEIKIENKNG